MPELATPVGDSDFYFVPADDPETAAARLLSWRRPASQSVNARSDSSVCKLPRHLDIDRTSDQDIQEIVLTTNLTPRKCLGFKTPFQALIAELGKDVQIRFC
jgi:IS30 family transposase